MATETTDREVDIHTWFGLTYGNYLVLPRTLLQSMPAEWQHRFTALLAELDDAFDHVPQAECYDVIAGIEKEVGDLSDEEMKYLGISRSDDDEDSDTTYYYGRDGKELEYWHRIVWPTSDPVPHYNRGRTRIEPRFDRQDDAPSSL